MHQDAPSLLSKHSGLSGLLLAAFQHPASRPGSFLRPPKHQVRIQYAESESGTD